MEFHTIVNRQLHMLTEQRVPNEQLNPIVKQAIEKLAEYSPQATNGRWLEDLTLEVAPYIKDYDIASCWHWSEWPNRRDMFPKSTSQDIGIDLVAIRASDGKYIAIQCKARQIDAMGQGAAIPKKELDTFISTSTSNVFDERWVVTNGDNPISANVLQGISDKDNPIKVICIDQDLQMLSSEFTEEPCPHCNAKIGGGGEPPLQTRTCMQREAVSESIRILKDHKGSDSGGLPVGEARGKIILPCGVGKTRVSLRIVEELTPKGQLSVVLCPSIALVAQIRREYLQHTSTNIRALAVCSDKTAGYDPKKESSRNATKDPTVDNSNVSATEIKGRVTTDSEEIATWIREGEKTDQISIIFGTYQSGGRIASALQATGIKINVLIADEAHRTAGLRRKRHAKKQGVSEEERRIHDFTLCHNQEDFPAIYRVYQTATPRIYDTSEVKNDKASDWIVRSMNDEAVFGVNLYEKSYAEAVRNGWLVDYRIVAVGVTGPDAHSVANQLAVNTQSKGRNKLSTTHFLRGLTFALAMGGAIRKDDKDTDPIKSCIAFMNTVDRSKNMAADLQRPEVKEWIQRWCKEHQISHELTNYTLKHLDASSNVTAREKAKQMLGAANDKKPFGIINVGIFGEGTDAPSLSAVAFLEARKSPIDVIQAVGRAMRTAPGKSVGYIICPIVIPPNVDPELWLSASNKEEGWQELGQILLALRAHDQRIEDQLSELLQLYIPSPPPVQHSLVAVVRNDKRIWYGLHQGTPGEVEKALVRILNSKSQVDQEFEPVSTQYPLGQSEAEHSSEEAPSLIFTGKTNVDGNIEIRCNSVERYKPKTDGTPGGVNIEKSKKKAKNMINEGDGIRVPRKKCRKSTNGQGQFSEGILLRDLTERGNSIKINLLTKSGLRRNRLERDLNILEDTITEASHHLKSDDLHILLDRHFGLDHLNDEKREKQADGCTIAALLLMNAAMLHQRIASGNWLSGISSLTDLKNETNVVRRIYREWNEILRWDFRPVLEPAVQVIESIEDSGKLAGLERTLRHVSSEAERIAETYADMGADHAGPLFNKVMGNQASDGAYFTRPIAASLAARLTLDAVGDLNWSDSTTWSRYKIVDPACGSGTLLAAMLTEMKRKAIAQGAKKATLAELHKSAVEYLIKGMDINPVSLQLAAAQLTTGSQEIRYRQMGLHLMPYGPKKENPAEVSVGTLELLGQRAIVPRKNKLDFEDEKINSLNIWNEPADPSLEDAVSAAQNANIVIMNPPFTNREKMGEKFPKEIQKALRTRVDTLGQILIKENPLADFVDKTSIRPLFVSLAGQVTKRRNSIVTMILPTIILSNKSGENERKTLAKWFHIDTILTCHQPSNINLSQHTSINESIVVLRRNNSIENATRFINLDRFPNGDSDVQDLHRCITECDDGIISNGWGEISWWPNDLIANGDWTAGVFRSPILAKEAARYATHPNLHTIQAIGGSVHSTGPVLRKKFEKAIAMPMQASFPIIKSKSADGQTTIESRPDEHWAPKYLKKGTSTLKDSHNQETEKILQKAGYLLITAGQDTSTARLVAVASKNPYVGNGWMPVTGISLLMAQALAVFLNSTPGRLQVLRIPGKKFAFPSYSSKDTLTLKVPDVRDKHIAESLAKCWEKTRDMVVPQYKDGECKVRQIWDDAVAEVMGWDPDALASMRHLIHREPHVCGLSYNQFPDTPE